MASFDAFDEASNLEFPCFMMRLWIKYYSIVIQQKKYNYPIILILYTFQINYNLVFVNLNI